MKQPEPDNHTEFSIPVISDTIPSSIPSSLRTFFIKKGGKSGGRRMFLEGEEEDGEG